MVLLGMWSWMIVCYGSDVFVLSVRCVGINGFVVNVFCLLSGTIVRFFCLQTICVGDDLFRGCLFTSRIWFLVSVIYVFLYLKFFLNVFMWI